MMPKRGPGCRIPETSSLGADGWPICVKCDSKLRAQFGGYGWDGRGHFCTKDCAAEWAEFKVQTIT